MPVTRTVPCAEVPVTRTVPCRQVVPDPPMAVRTSAVGH